MSYTLPSISSLLQLADTHQSRTGPPAIPGMFIGGAQCLVKRDISPSLEAFSPHKRPFPNLEGRIGRQPRTSLPIPIEIQNDILEIFWNHTDIECSSPETIRAAALTCRAWNKVARRHIFRVIILRSWEQIDRLKTQMLSDEKVIGWVQRVRLCGSLPPFDKVSSGKELPSDWAIQDRWLYLFPHHLSERIRDKKSATYQPFNIRIFELFDFGHLSGAVEDCKWFRFWIQHLPWLKNVETLYLRSCEMSANAMAALAHSFPRLRRVGLTNVDFTAKNYALFRPIMASVRTEEKSLKRFAKMCALKGIDLEEALRTRVPGNGIEYIGIHPIPALESFYFNNHSSQYAHLNLHLLYGWFSAHYAAKSLRSLELSAELDCYSFAEFINHLKPSPALEHLRMWAGYDVELLEHCGFDFSNLTKLKSLALRGTHPDDSQVDVFLYILDSLKTPELREFTLTLIHDNRFTALKRIDNRLSEKFKNLEL